MGKMEKEVGDMDRFETRDSRADKGRHALLERIAIFAYWEVVCSARRYRVLDQS